MNRGDITDQDTLLTVPPPHAKRYEEDLFINGSIHRRQNINSWHALLVARHRHERIVDVIRTNGFVNIVM